MPSLGGEEHDGVGVVLGPGEHPGPGVPKRDALTVLVPRLVPKQY